MNVLDTWLAHAAEALGLERDALQRDLLLDLTRDVAHDVARPAAPLTAFLVGLAAGRAGGRGTDVAEAARQLRQALATFSTTEASAEGSGQTRSARE